MKSTTPTTSDADRAAAAEPEPVAVLLPPHNVEAEQAVLGGLLIDNGAADRVADVISHSDFYRDDHRAIFCHIVAVIGRGVLADPITVARDIEQSEDRDKCGGLPYLCSLVSATPSARNVVRYAEIVREDARRRELAAFGEGLYERSISRGSKPAEIVRSIAAFLEKASAWGTRDA